MTAIHEFIKAVNGYLWGPPMLILLFGTHLFLTVRLRFIQRFIGKALKLSFRKESGGRGDISPFGSLTTALAATIGTGNIVGVATAVALGGPGSVLWMWLTGVFGMATKYSEALLSVKYRIRAPDGSMLGGPMFVLEKGLRAKAPAVLFALFTAVAAFGIGNMVQANSIAALARATFRVPGAVTGLVLLALTAFVILGGIRSIARVCTALVPFMALSYISGCVIILILNAGYIIPALKLILGHALTGKAAAGGFAGSAVMMTMRYGIARGLFSNESGMGSAPIVAAAAVTRNPVRQALVSSTGTFWDTVVICLMTGLVLVTGIMRDPEGMKGIEPALLTQRAFRQLPVIGPVILTTGLLTFVFSTILGWSYYGEKAVEYLFGLKAVFPYRILWILAVFLGSVAAVPLVWDFSDSMNALMAVPNLISLILLCPVLIAETRKYLWNNNLDELSND